MFLAVGQWLDFCLGCRGHSSNLTECFISLLPSPSEGPGPLFIDSTSEFAEKSFIPLEPACLNWQKEGPHCQSMDEEMRLCRENQGANVWKALASGEAQSKLPLCIRHSDSLKTFIQTRLAKSPR